MFKNLGSILSDEGMGIEAMAEILGIHRNTLSNKIGGKVDFTLPEAEKILLIFKRKYSFDYLFARHPEAS